LIVTSLLPAASSGANAQARRRVTAQPTAKPKAGAKDKKAQEKKPASPADEVAKLRDEFVRLTGDYKKSLGDLLPYQEREAGRAEEKLGKLRELKKEGLIAQRDVDAAEKTLADARAKVAETQQQMKAADAQIADALVEEKAVEQEAKAPPPARGKMIRTTAYIRYSGTGSFSLSSGAGRVMSFYTQTFRKQLPVSAFGQTAVHNQLGFDHRNAMDVALNPNSAEGQALVNYLRANGIPFFAFFMAIPGSATGPHIHVGLPSHKIR
jgi:sRNA-binding protein